MRYSILNISRQQWLNTIALLVGLSGLFTLSSSLFELKLLSHARLVIADTRFTVIAGLSLVYLAMVLRRGKRNAWLVALFVFSILVLQSLRHFLVDVDFDKSYILPAVTSVLLPAATLGLLILARELFNVKSEILSFTIALRRAVLILAIAFLYGVVGFTVLNQDDFGNQISASSAAHYTIDQFGLTDNHIDAHSRRSLFFVDSLAVISVASVLYAAVSFFAPIRFRLSHHDLEYRRARELVAKHSTTSEDFFKLWPHDKAYFFNDSKTAVIAYKVVGGVALCVGDPSGANNQLKSLVKNFEEYCLLNDWKTAFIHSEPDYQGLYDGLGFESQKIGEEAIINVPNFVNKVLTNKYFRHINNKFNKLGYACELLMPPHSADTIKRLRQISRDWLSQPGRSERGFMMGYFRGDYMQACNIFIIRDRNQDIQGFINELPVFGAEANFDFLRHSSSSPGNINDFLMLNFIKNLHSRNLGYLNMGLAPLAGLGKSSPSESQIINKFLHLAYSNGGRFYSFQGLARFKAKYQPEWQSRYIVYKGGIRGFTKTMNSLMRAMRLHRHLPR